MISKGFWLKVENIIYVLVGGFIMIVNEKEIKDDRNELFYNLYEK